MIDICQPCAGIGVIDPKDARVHQRTNDQSRHICQVCGYPIRVNESKEK